MKTVVLLLTLCALRTSCAILPFEQLFQPFGSFLQGDMLNPDDMLNMGQSFISAGDGLFNMGGQGGLGGMAGMLNAGDILSVIPDVTSLFNSFSSFLDEGNNLNAFFDQFLQIFGKEYLSAAEEQIRKVIFKNNMLKVFMHNLEALTGGQSYTQAVNKFADMNINEIVAGFTGYFNANQTHVNSSPAQSHGARRTRGNGNSWWVDWRGQGGANGAGIVGPVLNQGSCGACVYFAAAAVVESAWAKKGNRLESMSPQQLNDCAHDPGRGNTGCEHGSGTFVPTFDYIKKKGGLDTLKDYPYLMKDASCDTGKESHPVARIKNWTPVTPHGDENALKKAVDYHGPVAIALHVQDGFSRYSKGIYDEPCSGSRNHAVLVIGYGYDTNADKDYWILRNQWGTGWGEQGYMKIRRNHGNMCDVAGDAVWVE